MDRIQEKVVKIHSVADQIIESPVDTVIVVRYKDALLGNILHSDALVKTGVNGYRHARTSSPHYLHHDDIESWVSNFGPDAEFYFAFIGPGAR